MSRSLQLSAPGVPLLMSILGATATPDMAHPQRLHYPPARTADIVDDYHGTRVADPYRWLEDVDSEETCEWVAAENRVTEAYLARVPQRDAIRRRLTELWN